MREIKFRYVMTKSNGEIKIFYINLEDIEKQDFPIDFEECLLNGEEYIRNLFTGLKDKNGKEIYEGDILPYNTAVFEELFENFVVGFVDGSFDLFYDCRYESTPYCEECRWFWHDCEVIGNVYENPELISSPKRSKANKVVRE